MKSPAEYIADRNEFSRRRGLPGVRVEHMTTKRTADVILKLDGVVIGHKTEILKRGKVVSIDFVLPSMEGASWPRAPTHDVNRDTKEQAVLSTLAILRHARQTGDALAAIDHLIGLGYSPERAYVAAFVDRTQFARFAEGEGEKDYEGRAQDVDHGYANASWAWPFVDADEAYVSVVGPSKILHAVGLVGASWGELSSLFCIAFRRGYERAHAAWLGSQETAPIAADGTTLGVGVRVEGGRRGTDDYDTGVVAAVDGEYVWVGWDSGVRTRAHASELRAEAE